LRTEKEREDALIGKAPSLVKGDLVKVLDGVFSGRAGLVLEDTGFAASFCWVLINEEPQWIHILDCELCDESST